MNFKGSCIIRVVGRFQPFTSNSSKAIGAPLQYVHRGGLRSINVVIVGY